MSKQIHTVGVLNDIDMLSMICHWSCPQNPSVLLSASCQSWLPHPQTESKPVITRITLRKSESKKDEQKKVIILSMQEISLLSGMTVNRFPAHFFCNSCALEPITALPCPLGRHIMIAAGIIPNPGNTVWRTALWQNNLLNRIR